MITDTLHFIAPNKVKSACNIYILAISEKGSPKRYLIGIEDINEGMSVTNASEIIATEIMKKYLPADLNPENCTFLEWYSYYNTKYDTIDQVEYNWDGKIASSPRWKSYGRFDQNPFF